MNKNVVKATVFVGTLALLAVLTAPTQSEAFSFKAKTHAHVEHDESIDYKNDNRLPWGIRHAHGIEKRVERGMSLPFGILKKFFDRDHDDDDDHDTEEKIRIESRSMDVSTSTASISFTTNIATEGTLTYSTSSNFETTTEVELELDNEHYVAIDGLTPDTTYYVKVSLHDEDNELRYVSGIRSFTTKAVASPEIEVTNVHITRSTSSVEFMFDTNIETEGTLYYSTSSSLTDALEVEIDLDHEHHIEVENLEPETTYYYKVVLMSQDGSAEYESAIRSLTTLDV